MSNIHIPFVRIFLDVEFLLFCLPCGTCHYSEVFSMHVTFRQFKIMWQQGGIHTNVTRKGY